MGGASAVHRKACGSGVTPVVGVGEPQEGKDAGEVEKPGSCETVIKLGEQGGEGQLSPFATVLTARSAAQERAYTRCND